MILPVPTEGTLRHSRLPLSVHIFAFVIIESVFDNRVLSNYNSISVSVSYRQNTAFVVRPSLIDWNPISRTHTLEQMLLEIGEPVYRWKRKEVVE